MYKKTILDNGLRLVTETWSQAKTAALGFWVEAGSQDETLAENGCAHFIEHMMFKGTTNRSALTLAKILDKMGGYSNGFTTAENTCYYVKALAADIPEAVAIFSDMLANSIFDEEELERERQVILEEISMVEDTPDELAQQLFRDHQWPGHALGRPIAGTWESAANLSRSTLLAWRKKYYQPSNIVVSAVGAINHGDLITFLNRYFAPTENEAKLERVKPVKTRPGTRQVYKDFNQTHICLGTDLPPKNSHLRFAASILNTILGGNMSSRLFQEIREKRGLAYSVYSDYSAYMKAGSLMIYAAVEPDKAVSTLELIKAELVKLINDRPSELELNDAKSYLTASLTLADEDAEQRMSYLAKNELTLGRAMDIAEVIENINAVTPACIQELAACYLAPEHLSALILGPRSKAHYPDL